MSSAVLTTGAATAFARDEPLRLEEIVVEAAARDARPLLDTTTAVTVIEGEDLERRQATSFEDLIGDAVGVSIDGGPRPIAQEPNIRGFQDEQLVLRIDGGRFNFNQAHRGRFFVDPDIVQRVEIVRGGGSTLYGSGALGGVIAVETKDAADLLAPDRDFGARVRGGYASNGNTSLASATAFGRLGKLDGLGFFGWRGQASDLTDGGGDAIRASEIDVLNGIGKLGFEPNEAHRFEVSGLVYRDDGVTPPNANTLAAVDELVDREAEVTNARASWTFAPTTNELINLSVLSYFNGLTITEDRDADGRNDETDFDTYGLEAVNRSQLDLGLPVTLVYGLEAFRDEQTASRDGALRPQFPNAQATTVGGFAEATVDVVRWLQITPGIRFDRYARDPEAADLEDVSDNFVSPRLGVSVRPVDGVQIYGNVARAFRAPTLSELYNDGTHFVVPGGSRDGFVFSGVNTFVPNPDLEPETSTQFEAGVRFDFENVVTERDRLRLNLGGYYADVDDFIDQRVNVIDFDTAVPGPDGLVVGGTTTRENVDARLFGFELEATYDTDLWFAGVTASLARGEGDDGEPLGSIPQDRITATLGLRPLDDVELGGRATFAAEQDEVPEDTEPGGAFAVVDVFATWRPTSGRLAGAAFRAGVDNILDADYRIFPTELAQRGRSAKVSAAFNF